MRKKRTTLSVPKSGMFGKFSLQFIFYDFLKVNSEK